MLWDPGAQWLQQSSGSSPRDPRSPLSSSRRSRSGSDRPGVRSSAADRRSLLPVVKDRFAPPSRSAMADSYRPRGKIRPTLTAGSSASNPAVLRACLTSSSAISSINSLPRTRSSVSRASRRFASIAAISGVDSIEVTVPLNCRSRSGFTGNCFSTRQTIVYPYSSTATVRKAATRSCLPSKKDRSR